MFVLYTFLTNVIRAAEDQIAGKEEQVKIIWGWTDEYVMKKKKKIRCQYIKISIRKIEMNFHKPGIQSVPLSEFPQNMIPIPLWHYRFCN